MACIATTSAANSEPGAPSRLENISVSKSEAGTRFAFEISRTTAYRFFTLKSPDRAVIDLYQVAPGHKLPVALSLTDTSVASVRTGVQPDGALRYVFDLRETAPARAFTLNPDDRHGYRIVVDIDNPLPDDSAGESLAATGSGPGTVSASPRPRPARRVPAKAVPHEPSRPAGEWSGYLSLDARLFPDSPAYSGQRDQNASIALRPEYFREWDNGAQQFSFIPYGRLDSSDSDRSHADIRELYWRKQQSDWALKIGVDVVFWGVTESQHLVDIVNQTDLVENIDGEEKLGQPMLNVDYLTDWGTWQVYLLPYFRERTYPGRHGRLRMDPAANVNHPVYQSDDKQQHVDYALRWSQYIGSWDIGLGFFSGTIRDPLLIPGNSGGKPTLTPYYLQIDQSSLDMQTTQGAWLWKLEAIYNRNKVDNYYAYVGGFEYTQFGIAGTAMDLGWLVEYNYDQRGRRSLTVLQDDIYFGLRLAGNDIAGSTLLAGIIVDTDNHSTFINIEASRRLSEWWTISLETRLFANIDRDDAFYYYDKDDYIGIELARFF